MCAAAAASSRRTEPAWPALCNAVRPFDVAGKTLLDSHPGQKSEQRTRTRRVAQVPSDVTRAFFAVLDGELAADQLLNQVRDSQDAYFLAATDVDDVAEEGITFRGKDHAPGGVLDPGEVASLQPITEDNQRLASHGARHKPRDHLAARPVRVLASTVCVERANDHRTQAIRATEAERIRLAGELGGGVGRRGSERMVLVHGRTNSGAVDLGGGDVDEPLQRASARRARQMQRAKGVD